MYKETGAMLPRHPLEHIERSVKPTRRVRKIKQIPEDTEYKNIIISHGSKNCRPERPLAVV